MTPQVPETSPPEPTNIPPECGSTGVGCSLCRRSSKPSKYPSA